MPEFKPTALEPETFDSLLEEYFFEDAFVIKTGVYPSYFSLWIDQYVPQIPEHSETLKVKRAIRKVVLVSC